MDSFGIPLLIIAVVAIFVVDIFSISYLKTALLDLRMRKPGFFLGSVGILIVSIALSIIMAGAFVPKTAVATETAVKETTEKIEVVELVEEVKDEQKEEKAPEIIQSMIQPTTILPKFSVWRGYYKNFNYNFIEVENGVPFVYMPEERKDSQTDLNNIVKNREGENIVIMANAGVFDIETLWPLGTTIQNNRILTKNPGNSDFSWTLVIDESNNVGYVRGAIDKNENIDYIDARTGELVKNRKIISAVYTFMPFILNNQIVNEKYRHYYDAYRARQIFCVKQNSYMIISNPSEGEDGGGWSFDDMVRIAEYRGCVSAINLDGGGSVSTAYRGSLSQNFSILTSTKRYDPTFIVFTADNLAPRGR